MSSSFRFIDEGLNRRLIDLLKRSGVAFTVDAKGVIRYSKEQEQLIENELIGNVRDSVFSKWQIIFCPSDWAERYKQYMLRHDVPFAEELIDNQLCFLIPRAYRPHSWKLEEVRRMVS